MATGMDGEEEKDYATMDAAASRHIQTLGYRVEFLLGAGSYGKVFRARSSSNELIAIKDADLRRVNPEHAQRELVAMQRIQHRNVVKLLNSFDMNNHLYILMVYANQGDVDNALEAVEKLDQSTVHLWFGQVARAVRHMHELGFAHQDIKTGNVLIHNGQALLTDFGLTVIGRNHTTKQVIQSTERLREVYYISPPEILLGEPYDPFAVDVWQLAVFLFYMWTKDYPFGLYRQRDLEQMIQEQQIGSYKNKFHRKCTFSMMSLLDNMFILDPSRRIKIDKVNRSPFLANYTVHRDI